MYFLKNLLNIKDQKLITFGYKIIKLKDIFYYFTLFK